MREAFYPLSGVYNVILYRSIEQRSTMPVHKKEKKVGVPILRTDLVFWICRRNPEAAYDDDGCRKKHTARQ